LPARPLGLFPPSFILPSLGFSLPSFEPDDLFDLDPDDLEFEPDLLDCDREFPSVPFFPSGLFPPRLFLPSLEPEPDPEPELELDLELEFDLERFEPDLELDPDPLEPEPLDPLELELDFIEPELP